MSEFYQMLKNSRHNEKFEKVVNSDDLKSDQEIEERAKEIFRLGLQEFFAYRIENKSCILFKGKKIRSDMVQNLERIISELQKESPHFPKVRPLRIKGIIKKIIKSEDKLNRTHKIYLDIITKNKIDLPEHNWIDLSPLIKKINPNLIPKMGIEN